VGEGLFSNKFGVFADTAGEDEGVRHAFEGYGEASDLAGEAEAEDVDGEPGGRIAGVILFGEHTQVVGDAAEADEAGLAIKEVGDFIEAEACFLGEKVVEVGIEVSAAGAHDEAFEGGEAHGGIDGFSIEYGGGAAAVAEVGGDQAAVAEIKIEKSRCLLGDVGVAGTMKAIATDLVLLIEGVRDGISVDLWSDALMKCGVEYDDLGNAGKEAGGGFDAEGIGDGVNGSEWCQGPDLGEHIGIDEHGSGEFLAAMDDSVTDGGDVEPFQRRLGSEAIESRIKGGGVISLGQACDGLSRAVPDTVVTLDGLGADTVDGTCRDGR